MMVVLIHLQQTMIQTLQLMMVLVHLVQQLFVMFLHLLKTGQVQHGIQLLDIHLVLMVG